MDWCIHSSHPVDLFGVQRGTISGLQKGPAPIKNPAYDHAQWEDVTGPRGLAPDFWLDLRRNEI